MATKSAKRRAKRGRPRLQVLYREPNGRPSRANEPADKLALEARAKMLGLSVISAKDPLAASFIGRLHMQHLAWEKKAASDERRPVESLSTAEYEAAVRYLEIHNDHAKAVQSEGAIYDGEGGGSGDPEAHAVWCKAAIARYDAARKAIMEAQREARYDNLWAALDLCILRDQPMSHMIGSLRILCNALARHFRTC